jgi:hypothetical protein
MSTSSLSSFDERYLAPFRAAFGVNGLRGALLTVAAVPTMELMEDTTGDSSGDSNKEGDDNKEEDVEDEERVVWVVDEEMEDEERISTGSATVTGASSNSSSSSYISTMDGCAAVTFFLGTKKGCSLLLNPSSFRDDTIVM